MAVSAQRPPIRRYRRRAGWDYAKGASLFITVATAPRRPLFGRVAGGADAVAAGYTVISGFISPGEQAVRDLLCRTPGARFVRILPSCIPNARVKPDSRYVASFAEGRYLEIARGNDEVDFGRAACLDLNEEIIRIATAEAGLAVYWRARGPQVLARHDPLPAPAPSPDGKTLPCQTRRTP